MTWQEQVTKGYRRGMSMEEGVQSMNALVTPCLPKPPLWGIFPRRQHKWEDYTDVLRTVTYTTLRRCRDCGLLSLSTGDY